MHIYAFGSVCRGEVDRSSDIDILAIVNGRNDRFNPSEYSIYSYKRIRELRDQGNPFAWHLFLEAKMVYSSDNIDYIRSIGQPEIYKCGLNDCRKFHNIFLSSKKSLETSNAAEHFDLASIFLGIRNFSTCYSLCGNRKPDFSRNSARNLKENSVPVDDLTYSLLERCRVLCTRGIGDVLSSDEIDKAREGIDRVDMWMKKILNKMEGENHE